MILQVPYIDQTPIAPTGCECVSAVMLLQYLGLDIDFDTFFRQYVDKSPYYAENGQWLGGDPNAAFVGDPHDPGAMGCYAPVICRALERALGTEWEIRDLTGADTQTLLRYLDTGCPVVYWCTLDMLPPVEGPSWQVIGENRTFTWRSNEHCMLLVGYDAERLWFLDPWKNHGLISHDRALAELRHSQQYAMAVTAIPKKGY